MHPSTPVDSSKREGVIANLPTDIILLIRDGLDLPDALNLADTCRGFRPLVSEQMCMQACHSAGLSSDTRADLIDPARAAAKLLCRPRVGTQNWSKQGGELKNVQHDFSKVVPLQDATMLHMRVDLHPMFISQQPIRLSCKDIIPRSTFNFNIRPGPGMANIPLRGHRLYMHEYATCPPLTELRVSIIDDDYARAAALDEDIDSVQESVRSYRIRNPDGITVFTYWTALFKFLNHPPGKLEGSYLEYIVEPKDFARCSTNLEVITFFYHQPEMDKPLWISTSGPLVAGLLTVRMTVCDCRPQKRVMKDCDWGVALRGIRHGVNNWGDDVGLLPTQSVSPHVKAMMEKEYKLWHKTLVFVFI